MALSRSARRVGLLVVLLATACSVYELPSHGSGGNGGVGSDDGEAASGSVDSATSGTGSSSSDAGTAGASGAPRGGAGSAGAAVGGGSGSGSGGVVQEPEGGGEGGAPSAPDGCPNDPNKLEPGACGCGIPDAPSPTRADCQTLKSLLLHRYDFEGGGTAVKDRIGSAHGVVARGSTLSKLDGRGVVLLGGGDVGTYVDLPNGLVSSLTDATFEAWITWGGGKSWQRIFDFGDSTHATPEDNQKDGKTYLFVTPQSGFGYVSVGYSLSSVPGELDVAGSSPLTQSLSQVVAVVSDTANSISLFVNGAQVAQKPWNDKLSKLNDVNVWLGRSQFVNDAELNAVYHEFRIYGSALTPAQVASAFEAGTDPKFLAY